MSEEIDINDIKADVPDKIEGDDVDWEAEAKKYHRIAKSRGKKIGQLETDYVSYKEKNPEKPKEQPQSQNKNSQSDQELLGEIERLTLRSERITADDEVELYNKWKSDTNRKADAILSNPIFQLELTKLRTDKSNAVASSGIKGGSGTSDAKSAAAYWIGKNELPTPENYPGSDRKTRMKIINEMKKAAKTDGKTFYNE